MSEKIKLSPEQFCKYLESSGFTDVQIKKFRTLISERRYLEGGSIFISHVDLTALLDEIKKP
jgi:hypothetical protein